MDSENECECRGLLPEFQNALFSVRGIENLGLRKGKSDKQYCIFRWDYSDNPLDMGDFTGQLRPYLTHGAACTEVEIDCLTGQHRVSSAFYSLWC